MKILSVLLLVTVYAHHTYGQVWGFGTCPNIPPADMNLRDLEGDWFEAERYFFMPQVTTTCVQATYKVEGNVANVQIRYLDSVAELHQVMSGKVDPIASPVDGRLQLTLKDVSPVPMMPTPTVGVVYPYSVVHIDNDCMVKFSCRNFRLSPFFPSNFQSLWVLVRDRTYPDAVKNKVESVLKRLSISTAFLRRTDRNCPANLNFREAADSSQVENEIAPPVNSTVSE